MNRDAPIFPASALQKADLRATDGVVGRVDDLLFDDHLWRVRYLVIDTGGWLAGRRVLISPAAVRTHEEHCLTASLSRAQVESSPGAGTAGLTRADEEKLHEHYRWPPYWGGVAGGFGLAGDVMPDPATRVPPPHADAPLTGASGSPARAGAGVAAHPELRSARHLRTKPMHATDGEIGEIDDLLIDTVAWQVRYLVVDTRRWWPGGRVIVAPAWLAGVDWDTGHVSAALSRDAIKASPKYEAEAPLSHEYAERLHRHYHRAPSDDRP